MLSQHFFPHIVLAMWCRQSTLEEFHTLFNIKLKKETEMQNDMLFSPDSMTSCY